jgi:two-component system sensor histidine kinase BaeS
MKISLKTKLSLAFVLVALITAAVLALVFNRFNQRQFNQFVIDNQRAELISVLTNYYKEHQSWDGARIYFSNMARGQGQGLGQGQNTGPGSQGRGRRQGQADSIHHQNSQSEENTLISRRLFGLAAPDGTVLIPSFDSPNPGEVLDAEAIALSMPIVIEEEIVGYLLSPNQLPGYSEVENRFVRSSNLAMLIALAGAIILASIIAIIIARSITKPIETLSEASQRIANRELDTKVPELGKDEIGMLAKNFNEMSDRLEESDRLRKQMTADIAHDLRTPLTVINGYVESMRDGDLSVTPERLGLIADETTRLSKLVDDLRLLSVADAGELNLQKQLTNPNELLEHCHQLFENQAARKSISLKLEPLTTTQKVLIDEGRMIQALSNLLNNAIDYSPEGSEVILRLKEEKACMLLEIIDSGPGIDPANLPYIFERFHRADRSRQESASHSGLGLSIAKAIITAHNGEILAISALGQGTSMQIRLAKQ